MRVTTGHKRGAVSIFVVIFTALLVTVVTVSFTRLMLREQQRASNVDLSQSAYDAALAGVEDAKRALSSSAYTGQNLTGCNAIAPIIGATTSTEGVRVGSANLQQWYSCVKVETDTENYERPVGGDETVLVPIRATSAVTEVVVEWFSKDDVSGGNPSSPNSGSVELTQSWPQDRPSVLETQLIQTNRDGFRLGQFDPGSSNMDNSNTNTLILYPTALSGSDPIHKFVNDIRLNPDNNAPTATKCVNNFNNVYACKAIIGLPSPVGGNNRAEDTAFLRLTPRYKGAHVRVTLRGASVANPPKFKGVQPLVDSTGRSGDLFRRVKARIEPAGGIYPEAAVDVTNNFCKTFRITNDAKDYSAGSCFPGTAGP